MHNPTPQRGLHTAREGSLHCLALRCEKRAAISFHLSRIYALTSDSLKMAVGSVVQLLSDEILPGSGGDMGVSLRAPQKACRGRGGLRNPDDVRSCRTSHSKQWRVELQA